MLKNSFVNWVNKEVGKKLDSEPFMSLPLRVRIGIFTIAGAFILGYGGSALILFISKSRNFVCGALLASFCYTVSWILGAMGIALAGKDCIKYPVYFFAKFLKILFPSFFEETRLSQNVKKKREFSKFYTLTFITLIFITVFILVYLFLLRSIFLIIGIITLVLFHQICYIYGMFSVRSNFFFNTVKGKEFFKNNCKGILFRFDDGPDPVYTNRILDILKSENIHALFAITGKNAEKYPEIVRRIHEEGHIIANHTYSHPFDILLMNYKEVYKEIKRANDVIYQITGVKPKFFCPTIGQKNHIIGRVIKELDLIPVMWDIRSIDTHLDSHKIIQRIMKKIKAPSIILFHDSVTPLSKQDRNATIYALYETIKLIKEKNFIPYNNYMKVFL